MANAGRPIPHVRLLDSVWGPEHGNKLEYLRTFMREIRKKIQDDPANPIYLLTDLHVGYRFAESAVVWNEFPANIQPEIEHSIAIKMGLGKENPIGVSPVGWSISADHFSQIIDCSGGGGSTNGG